MCDCGAYDCKRCGPLQGYYGIPCERCGSKDYDCECDEEIDELPSGGASTLTPLQENPAREISNTQSPRCLD